MASIHLPSKIAAIGIAKTGDIDVIQNLELPFPSPTPTQFIIKVRPFHHDQNYSMSLRR